MRKKIFKFVIYIMMCFFTVYLLNMSFKNLKLSIEKESVNSNESLGNTVTFVEELKVEKYDYDSINKVKLLHSKENSIEEIFLDEYIVNVIAAEMPVEFELEALKAQAIVARTYTLYKITKDSKHVNADICDDSTCCQAWISKDKRFEKWEDGKQEKWNKLVRAVNETKGKYITYNGDVINAFFHSNSSGRTENPIDVWGGSLPYLGVVETAGEENYTSYKSEVRISKEELERIIREKFESFRINFNDKECIKILEYTDSMRVRKIKIGNIIFSGVDVRKLLTLKSTNFNVVIDGDYVLFKVLGYGHGVGLSQTGSDALAKNGMKAEEIIKHFYKNIEIHE